MFVTKKKFNQLKETLVRRLWIFADRCDLDYEVLSEHIQQVDERRKNGIEALSKIVERNRNDHMESTSREAAFITKIEGRLREAETRIDNLIEANNDAVKRHNHNIYKSNEAIDKCNERFAKYESLIENLQSQVETQAAISKGLRDQLSVNADLSAVYFHYENGLEVGATYWIKANRSILGAEMIIGKWDGMRFVLPDGKKLSHKSVIKVGDIIETPEL